MVQREKRGPAWFDLRRYDSAADLDAADWLLNLTFRGWLARNNNEFGLSVVQGSRPILRRSDGKQLEELEFLFLGRQEQPPPNLLELFRGGPLRTGVDPLSVMDFYFFEQKLPSNVRHSGANFKPGGIRRKDDPPAFFGRLDHAFVRPYLERFVRVNLALPDRVLLHDLASFLRRERSELAARKGPQPYREAVRLAEKKRPRLKTLAKIGLLPFLDLQRWIRSREPTPTDYEVADLIGIEPNRMREVHEYADRYLQEMRLRAWLEPVARGVPSRSKRRG